MNLRRSADSRSPVCLPHARRKAMRRSGRRGLAVGWLLIWFPVFVLALFLSVEFGNLQLSQIKLHNSLEAAALAGAKQWKETGDTNAARLAAFQYARANSVNSQLVELDLNDGGGPPNDNLAPDGEIVLGAVSLPEGEPSVSCPVYIFDPDTSPGIGGSGVFVSLSVQVLTNADTKNDVQNGFYSFSVFDFSSNQAGLEISQVQLNVATTAPVDLHPPFFDLRNPPGMGVGTDKNDGIEPIFQGTSVANFTASPAFANDTTSSTYQINFLGVGADAFEAGTPIGSPSADKFEFGVDTDQVGPDTGTGDNQYADHGGDFPGTTVTVCFQLAGSPVGCVTGVMSFVDAETSIVVFDEVEITSGNFGVVARKTMTITPICQQLLGIPLGPFQVCGEAAAMCEAPDGAPQLIRTIPPPP
ncbi:MAG: hypothetical protein KDA42_08775 [Planctomycetales bacterium]|nr:hypothetical protein [Planctomycetales bacterium]